MLNQFSLENSHKSAVSEQADSQGISRLYESAYQESGSLSSNFNQFNEKNISALNCFGTLELTDSAAGKGQEGYTKLSLSDSAPSKEGHDSRDGQWLSASDTTMKSTFKEAAENVGLKPEQVKTGEKILNAIEQGSYSDLKSLMQANPEGMSSTMYAVSQTLATKGIKASYQTRGFTMIGNEVADGYGDFTMEGNGVSLSITSAGQKFDSAQDIAKIDAQGYGKPITPESAFGRLQERLQPLF